MTFYLMMNRSFRTADSMKEMADLIDDLMTGVRRTSEPLDIAELAFVAPFPAGSLPKSDHVLHVSVNRASGYGSIIWSTTSHSTRGDEISSRIWVTDNPSPPASDPRILGDSETGIFQDRRNAIPLSDVRAVLLEFCRSGTGDRPGRVSWVESDLVGRRERE